mmetsp:Transcript_95175/g.274067  ORF Transcript_95175/g.274067 Transcript_95175/m.274067 type:complete len:252 (-) Transcript_95175:110-865(-)
MGGRRQPSPRIARGTAPRTAHGQPSELAAFVRCVKATEHRARCPHRPYRRRRLLREAPPPLVPSACGKGAICFLTAARRIGRPAAARALLPRVAGPRSSAARLCSFWLAGPGRLGACRRHSATRRLGVSRGWGLRAPMLSRAALLGRRGLGALDGWPRTEFAKAPVRFWPCLPRVEARWMHSVFCESVQAAFSGRSGAEAPSRGAEATGRQLRLGVEESGFRPSVAARSCCRSEGCPASMAPGMYRFRGAR